MRSMIFLLSVLTLISAGSPVHAQPAVRDTGVATVPEFSPSGTSTQKTPEEQAQDDSDEARGQKERQEFRETEISADGFKWTPWLQAGKNVWNFVLSREPYMKTAIGDGKHVDVAVYDLDQNGQPDIVISLWGHDDCGTDGCAFYILFDRKDKKIQNFILHSLKPFKKGVLLDNKNYYSL